ncbi:hypothetical protein ASD02_34755 [Ensifer sp. Root1252]|nr:hypothetical protein ASD02_34755 [Ensifer sp. Root1252]KQW78477.1 hypothetical protein ASD03_25650 [Ensifer sp. Root127]KRC69381.1 hypothetical protein ASE32_34580 [Ensifer sp. Root231]KRC96657.1 hypothetical protein ASE47_30845 [Ensifer sp. Root258]PSS61406.1 hypothetical protein C6558_27195 [Ensifer sp. NM-2]
MRQGVSEQIGDQLSNTPGIHEQWLRRQIDRDVDVLSANARQFCDYLLQIKTKLVLPPPRYWKAASHSTFGTILPSFKPARYRVKGACPQARQAQASRS